MGFSSKALDFQFQKVDVIPQGYLHLTGIELETSCILKDGFLQAHYWTSRHHYVISHARLTSDSEPTVQASFADETAGPWVAFAADGTAVAATDAIVAFAAYTRLA
ncbi:hypothetical protein Tco_0285036 [Tanacetum coccineum]